MGRLVRVLVVVAVLLAVFLVKRSRTAPPPETTKVESAQQESEVRQELTDFLNSYGDAWVREDMETFMSMYSSDARVFWPGMNLTKDEIPGVMSGMFQATKPTGYDPTIVDLFVYGDAAYVIYEVVETLQMEGQEPETTAWNCFSRFTKGDGGWKFHRDVCGLRDGPAEG